MYWANWDFSVGKAREDARTHCSLKGLISINSMMSKRWEIGTFLYLCFASIKQETSLWY